MFDIFMEHRLLTGGVLSLLLLSIICQIMIGVIYQNMIREADNMSATDNKLLKKCKLKFSNCYQLNGGVSNIPVFVDKYLDRVKIMGITLNGYKHLSAQFMLLSVFGSGVGACAAIAAGETVGRILPYYVLSFLELYIYFSISGLVDINGKRSTLKNCLIDYLENHMISRLKKTDQDLRITLGQAAGLAKAAGLIPDDAPYLKRPSRSPQNTADPLPSKPAAAPSPQEEKAPPAFTPTDEAELELLLKEFLA